MKVPVVNVENEKVGEVDLPLIFKTKYRPDIIKKAVLAQQSNHFQLQGRDQMAGKRTTAESWGVGRGRSRVPRIKNSSRAAFGVSIVGGHQAFPPRAEKKIKKSINKKERKHAIRSGIAATAMREIVASRGHILDIVGQLPLVVEDNVQNLTNTKDVKGLLIKIGAWLDIERANRKKIRAGKGKTRGRKRKVGKGPLIVIKEDHGIRKSSRNLPGVDVIMVEDLNAETLAPGTHPGRLTMWAKTAFDSLDKVWGRY